MQRAAEFRIWGAGLALLVLIALIVALAYRNIGDRQLITVILGCGLAAEVLAVGGIVSLRRERHRLHQSQAKSTTAGALAPTSFARSDQEQACNLCESLTDSFERKILQRELHISREKLHLALESGTIGMWFQDLACDEVELSENLHALYGFDAGARVTPADVFARIHPDDQPRLIELQKALPDSENEINIDYRVISGADNVRWCVAKGRVLRNADGERATSQGVVIDVTEVKEATIKIESLNRQLQHQAAELRAVNRELESFSYSVSHDLRAPLRSIDGFSNALLEDHGEALDEAARDYLNRICQNARRMGELIDDLLSLARVSRWEFRPTTVDLTATAHAIVAELKARDPQREVSIKIDDDMTAEGDGHLLRMVLQNLIDNSWKYTAKSAAAQIHFGRRKSSGHRVFFVADNGAGFDMSYAEKLFQPFQRLHAAHEFEGNGIGLATVRRIIHRHSGEVWAEGKVGHGAIISFTIGVKGEPNAREDDTARRGQPGRRRVDATRAQEEQHPQ